jgi:xylulokinase
VTVTRQYIIAYDVGTGGSKAVLVDMRARVLGSAIEPYSVHYPRPGWAEQEPEDWWRAVTGGTRQLLERYNVRPADVLCTTFTTQMLGILPMDAQGKCLQRAIIWLDARAGQQAGRVMRRLLHPSIFAAVAGTRLSGKDWIPKLWWLRENAPELYAHTAKILDVNGYLLYRATGQMAIDWTAASATGMFDLSKKTWDNFIIKFFDLPLEKMPELKRPIETVGVGLTAEAARELGLLAGTPVIAGAGDALTAAVGSAAVEVGDQHVYLGTSSWVGVIIGKKVTGKSGIATIQAADPTKNFLFAENETAGACLKWIADEFYRSEQADPAVENVYALMDADVQGIEPGSKHLIFTPWMYGERAPIDDIYVRSTFFNLSADHKREHLLRAVYEGVAYNLRWTFDVLNQKFHLWQDTVRVVGGGARGNPWLQIVADVTKKRVERVANPQEAGAVGAAMVAAIGLGIYPDFPSLKRVVKVTDVFEPQGCNAEIYDRLYNGYRQVYKALRKLYRKANEERFRGTGAHS